MSFEIEQPKTAEEIFYERKAVDRSDVDFPADMSEHKDLFETISEAHYLPELGGPHDEALLESLVEKGCEDNQILGQALDKLAHLVQGTTEYPEEEEDMLLGNAPVSDIIERLEQSLESPGRSSMTAAQGLLHLHHIGDHLQQADAPEIDSHAYISDRVFVSDDSAHCALDSLTGAANDAQVDSEIKNMNFNHNDDKRLNSEIGLSEVLYTAPVPDSNETFLNKQFEEPPAPSLPDQSDVALPSEDAEGEVEGHTLCNTVVESCDKSEAESNIENIDNSIEPEQNATVIEIKQEESLTNTHDDSLPTDLSIQNIDSSPLMLSHNEVTNGLEDNVSDKSDEQPKDLSVHKRVMTPGASPRCTEVPRAPSRESDAMQSPQPSGIPAVPSSPEIFTMPLTKSKQTLFLETLLSSPSPKMYTSEVTITKQQCEPLNLGKHRKSASPTVSSCSDEIKKLNKEFGEPQEKKSRRESIDDLAKISKVFNKCSDEQTSKKSDRSSSKPSDVNTPLQQFNILKSRSDYTLPDPLLIPKDKLEAILAAPAREIPALLIQRPELRLPATFAFPAILQDPDILVVSLTQLEHVLLDRETKQVISPKTKEHRIHSSKGERDQTAPPKPIPSMDALAGDIDAATSAALNQMLWLPYLSQLEAMAACSQNMDFMKALNSTGYGGPNYPDISQMFNPSARFMGAGFPATPAMQEYDSRMQFAMWQEAMAHAAATRPKASAPPDQCKEASKSSDVQNPYVHSTKSHGRSHSAARTSPIATSYSGGRPLHNPFLGAYGPAMRPSAPPPGLQLPYLGPPAPSQRSPRGQQKSPPSPYFPNNNYLQAARSGAAEAARPRISVKSLQNLLEPGAAARGRREEPEVGSTTPADPRPPHDPAAMHLWHPLFGNQKSYNSPWSWTTVTATGD
ncbi:uncharacterized protein LOC111001279 [Pieris rapae]|uniref:uncharacterized protein LOC111001279 n=1 Tax=Pieris rapae TaxID=64459 RepID=UPI001E281922|nr:uncharacterized protein LOC111001279 [Pieris rapae]